MEIVYRKLADMFPHPDNPRDSSPEDVEELAKSIEANGDFFEARPILLSDRTGKNVIIGGERRWMAAKLLGMDTAPSILMTGLTEEREVEILMLDNVHRGRWDEKKLAVLASQWGGEKIKSWAPDVKWDADAFVKSAIPELAGLGEEKTLAEILNQEGALARERIIITYPPEKRDEIAKLIHVDSLKKVMYRFEEICGS